MKKTLLLLLACLFGALGGVKAWTSVVPYNGRTYYLYNPGTTSYWYGTNATYTTTANIADATPITVESGHKLAFQFEGTTYRISHNNGTLQPWRTDGTNFTFEGGPVYPWGYQIRSDTDHARWMCPDGTFQQSGKYKNRDWQFISVYEQNLETPNICATAAEASYLSAANGWERVTDNATLEASLSDYFFAIVCANYPGLMVNMADGNASQQAGGGYTSSKSMWYSNSANPEADNSFLWMIEKCNESGYEGYTFRNASYPSLTIQAEGSGSEYAHTHDQPNPCRWSSYALTPTDGVFIIKTLANGGDNYLGLWTPSNDYINGQELAGNKGTAEQGKFLIYRKRIKNANLTSYITNPSFENGMTGWTNHTEGFFWTHSGGSDVQVGNSFAEHWQDGTASGSASLTQTLANLPAGIYKLTANTRNTEQYNSDAHGTGMFLKLGNDRTEVNSTLLTETYTVLPSAGNLEIGIVLENCTGNWVQFDNFTLTYIEGLHDLTPVSGKMKASVEAAQTAAVNAYNSDKTVEKYFAAKEAIANAEASIAAYANALTYLEKVEEVLATTNFYTTAAYNSVYDTYKTAYDAGTMEDATAAGLSYKTPSYTPAGARYTDNTPNDLLIPGWTIGGNVASVSGSGFYINTWSTESAGSGDAADFANPFYEYYVDSGSLPATELSGTLTGLTPNTMYRVTANVRIQGTANSGKIKMQVGTGGEIDVTKGNQIGTTTRYIKDYVAVGKTDADGKLTLKFTVESESGISWLSFRDVMYAEQDDDFTYIIKQADCNTTSQEYWPGSGRSTATGQHYSGDASRVYFTFQNGTDRHQDVTFPATGKYLLKTAVRCTTTGSFATMKVGDDSQTTNYSSSKNLYVIGADGNETTTVNSDGGNWVYNELYFDATAGDTKTITIQLSDKDNANHDEADCGGMTLTYLGTEGTLVGMEVSAVAKAGTFVAPFDVVIPARTTAYTVKAAGNGYITLKAEAAAGATLAANTPVILYAEDGIASKISKQFYGTATGSANENGNGYLIGMYNAGGTIDADAQNYVMQYNSIAGKPEFRQVTTANFATTANRSYLKLNANSESRVVIKFDGEDPTAINAIEAAEAEDGALKDGKYLIDGKIVIVKNGVKYGANGQKLN